MLTKQSELPVYYVKFTSAENNKLFIEWHWQLLGKRKSSALYNIIVLHKNPCVP